MEWRQQQQAPESDEEAWGEIAEFLRTVTPPPTNYMSVPTEPYTPTTITSSSSIRRRESRKKRGTLTRCLLFLRGRSIHKKPARKPSVRVSSPVARPALHKHKRPPRITLPDSAISGRTIDGHRHIAISIPVEHDLLSPAPRYRFPRLNMKTKTTPTAEISQSHNDVTSRPKSAFVDEPQVGTQLRPVAEKQGSRSSKSRGKEVQRGQEAVRELRLPWRDTFGAPQEVSSSNADSMQPPVVPRRINNGHDAPRSARPSTPPTSDEARRLAHRKALAALSRPVSGQSAYSFRSSATASPASKVSPSAVRNFSLHPGSVDNKLHHARSNSRQRDRNPHSRDSSRDQHTLQESIFSEPHFLESKGTLESASEVDRTAVTGTTQARRSSSTVEASLEGRNRSARESGQNRLSGQSLERVDISPNVQETRRDSGQETGNSSGQESKTPHWTGRDTAAPVSVNPAMKTVEAHMTRPSQLRKSVQIVLETPEEDSWPDDLGNSRGDANDDGLRGVGNDRNKGPESKGGNNKEQTVEASSMLQVPGGTQENRRKGSPLPSPEQREEMRKKILLLRRQKIVKLRKALEDPETQPKDLVWRRNPSDSSDGSSDESHMTNHGSDTDKRTTLTPEGNQDGLEATPAQSKFSTVMTVADVRPSSPLAANPELGIASKESLPLSASSLDTVATAIKVPSMPPYQYMGHVTPPDSPPQSQTSISPVSSVEAQPGGTPLRHPPLKRLPSLPRRSSTFGRRPPVLPAEISPVSQGTPQPNMASKGPLPSTSRSGRGPEGESTEANTSIVKLSRSQLFEMHDTLREEQTRDIERRLQRLERNRDDWLATMLPLLTDMTQVLGKFASSEGHGEGKEGSPKGDRQVGRLGTSVGDDSQNPNWRRISASEVAEPNARPFVTGDQDDVLDSDEVIRRHTQTPHGRSRAGTSTSEHTRRVYIDNDLADDEQERRARSSSLGESSKRRRHRAHTTNVPPPALPAEAANLRAGRPLSGTLTRSPQAPALPQPTHVRGESEAGRERAGGPERSDKRVDARLRSLSMGARVPGGPTRYDSRREAIPDFYAATANDGRYNETLEGLMRGSPSRVGRRSGTKSS
ncbi:hypothetical protein VPNG_03609 [Cytospora leucostoma]|uniref:Uncharacterized protein n=1 Tax=Cytospora leucostoma TaxID=1230097 RepID=A0A423XCR5_9PEZI|nr:hypothetical protein VPNG_03609 [Cytospora leucostoma]